MENGHRRDVSHENTACTNLVRASNDGKNSRQVVYIRKGRGARFALHLRDVRVTPKLRLYNTQVVVVVEDRKTNRVIIRFPSEEQSSPASSICHHVAYVRTKNVRVRTSQSLSVTTFPIRHTPPKASLFSRYTGRPVDAFPPQAIVAFRSCSKIRRRRSGQGRAFDENGSSRPNFLTDSIVDRRHVSNGAYETDFVRTSTLVQTAYMFLQFPETRDIIYETLNVHRAILLCEVTRNSTKTRPIDMYGHRPLFS